MDFTPVLVAAVAGIIISVAFEWIPGLNTWYTGLANGYQKLIMAGLMALISFGILGLNCVGWFTSWIPKVSCDQAGVELAIVTFIAAISTNQITYLIGPKKGDLSA